MFRSSTFRKLLLCLGIEMAVLLGAPVRPNEIEDLLRDAAKAKIEFQIEQTRDRPGDDE